MIHKIFYGIDDNSTIRCWRNHKLQKGDILLSIKGVIKSISIKCSSRNSVYAEHIYYFKKFLKDSNIFYRVILMFNSYYYEKDEKGRRVSSKGYKRNHAEEILEINKAFQNIEFVNKCIDRFVLKGTNCNYKISGIIYGVPGNLLFISSKDIRRIILSKSNMQSSGVYIGPLFIEPMARNLNNNPKYEKLRHTIQVKWFSLFDDIMQVYYDKGTMF